MNKHWLEIFSKIGISATAGKLYLIALSAGADTVQNLAKHAQIKRATAYVAVAELMKHGLMSSFFKGKKSYFLVSPPEQILVLIKNKEFELERERREIELTMSELRAIYQKPEGKIAVKYYEGKEGVMRMVKDFLHEAAGDTIQMAYPVDRLLQLFSREELNSLFETRHKKKVKTETFYTLRQGVVEAHPEGTRIKIDANKYPLQADIAIFKNKIRIASLGEHLSGVVIEDRAIVETLRSLFQLAFDSLKHKSIKQ